MDFLCGFCVMVSGNTNSKISCDFCMIHCDVKGREGKTTLRKKANQDKMKKRKNPASKMKKLHK